MQFAPARLVDDAAAQASSQDVQLGFAHCPLEPKQQPVVEVRRVVDSILVENQGVGQCADLK